MQVDANKKTDSEQNNRSNINGIYKHDAINNETENDEAGNDKRDNTEYHERDIQDQEIAQSFGKRNLYLYYNADGHPRYGRHEPTVDNSDRANPPNSTFSTASPLKQIDVHYINRNSTRDKPNYNRNNTRKQIFPWKLG